MEKKLIEEAVVALLESAANRETKQGVLVYTKILEMLASAKSAGEVEEIRNKLNQTLVGIEAHGHLTKEEFEIVRNLRE